MKKFSFLIFTFFTTMYLFCQNVTFQDVNTKFEKLITCSTFEKLRDFSIVLDLYTQSKEYESFKKNQAYKENFQELQKETKNLLNSSDTPWSTDNNDTQVSIRLLNEKFYYFFMAQNVLHTRRTVLHKIFSYSVIILLIFIIVLTFIILYFQNQKKQNQLFTKAMLNGQEHERKRISEDLHDTLAQSLKVERFFILELIAKNKEGLNIETELDELLEKSKSNISEIRTILQNLIPPDFNNQMLEWTISELCESVTKNHNIKCSYLIDPESHLSKFTGDKKLNLYRIIQEAVNNAVYHSKCTEIQIFITKKEVIINDNGTGFNYHN